MADPIRVLWLIKGLGPGGAEQLLVDAAAHVDRTRFSYSVAYLLPQKDHLVDDLRAAEIPVRCLGMGRMDPSWLLRLRRVVAEERIDVVHAHSPVPAIGARLIAGGSAGPAIITTEHNVWSRYRPLTRRLNAWTTGRQDAIVAVSQEVRRSMGGRTTPPVSVILNGVDVERLRASVRSRASSRADLGLPPDVPVIGTVGGLTPKKGHLDLVEAARMVVGAFPDARFAFVGLPVVDAPVRAAIGDAGLAGHITLAGFREHAAELLAAFDIFCLPSHYEGMPVSLLEAMALGLPCLATRVGGVPEVMTDDRDGLLVPPSDPPALAAGLLRLLRDDDLRQRLGAGARSTAVGFDIRTMVAQTEALYRTVLEARRG